MSWFVYVCWDFGLCRLLAAGNRHSIKKFEYTGNRSYKAGDRLKDVCVVLLDCSFDCVHCSVLWMQFEA